MWLTIPNSKFAACQYTVTGVIADEMTVNTCTGGKPQQGEGHCRAAAVVVAMQRPAIWHTTAWLCGKGRGV